MALSNRIISHTVIAVTVARRRRLAVQAALTKEIPLLMDSDNGFLALLGNHGDLALAAQDVKDSICRISLAEDYFILSIFRFRPSPVCVGEERLKNEGLLPLGFYGQGSALDTCRVRVLIESYQPFPSPKSSLPRLPLRRWRNLGSHLSGLGSGQRVFSLAGSCRRHKWGCAWAPPSKLVFSPMVTCRAL